jgi:hypothetical protein
VTASRVRRSVVHVTDEVGADCADYEYDLAHDEIEEPGGQRPPTGRTPPVAVDLAAGESAGDDGGDYGYDLAHDGMR